MLSRLFVAVVFSAVSVDALLDCTRDKALCKNAGDCEYPAGTCNCKGVWSGERCEERANKLNKGRCTSANTCVNGKCFKSGNGIRCVCDEGFIGTNCETRRYDTDCDYDNSAHTNIKIVPDLSDPTTFTGRVFVAGHSSTPACVLTCTGGVCSINSIAFSACGGVVSTPGPNTRVITIEYSSGSVSSGRDELVHLTCGSSNDLDVDVTLSSAAGDPDQDNFVDLVPQDADVAISLSSSSVTLGDEVTLTIDLTDDGKKRFEQSFINSCRFEKPDGSNQHAYLSDGCPEENYIGANVQSFSRSGTQHDIVFTAIRIDEQDSLQITCSVKVCLNEDDCAQITCARGTSYGRKKRQTQGSTNGTLKQVQARLRVLDNGPQTQTLIAEACGMKWQTTATVVTLAICFVIALIACIVLFAALFMRRKKTRDGKKSESTSSLPNKLYA